MWRPSFGDLLDAWRLACDTPKKDEIRRGIRAQKLKIRSNTHIYVFYIELYKHITIYHGSIFMNCITNLPYRNMYLSVTLNCHSFKNSFT